MSYIKVKWGHDRDDDPILLYSELDDGLWEMRKVEIFRDGTIWFASREASRGDTGLSIEPLPPLSEIASDPQFEPFVISRDEFEEVWRRAVGD